MIKIVVTQREHDIHACLKGFEAIWGCGKSVDEAIGSMIRAHPLTFNIQFVYPEKKVINILNKEAKCD